MTEYWLQKKTISGWSNATWYDNQEQALKNLFNCAGVAGGSGYSWRVMKAEVVEQRLLDEVVMVEAPELEAPIKTGWGAFKSATPAQAWGKPSNAPGFSPSPSPVINLDDTHGGKGMVWVIKHSIKSKKKIQPNELEYHLANGWERGGPRTEFREG